MTTFVYKKVTVEDGVDAVIVSIDMSDGMLMGSIRIFLDEITEFFRAKIDSQCTRF